MWKLDDEDRNKAIEMLFVEWVEGQCCAVSDQSYEFQLWLPEYELLSIN